MSYLTHFNVLEDPFDSEAACDFVAADGETFGMTGKPEYVTCPDCMLRVEAS